jgi:hypothetical protein
MHIAANAAARMLANELAALNCCTAMNPHKAIALPNLRTV